MVAYRTDENLDNLRNKLTREFAQSLIILLTILMWLTLIVEPFPTTWFLQLGLLLATIYGVLRWVETHPNRARRLLVGVCTMGLLAAMIQLNGSWLPFFGLLLVFVGSLLVTAGGVVTALAVGATAVWQTEVGARGYPLAPLIVSLILGVGLTHLAIGALYTALDWAWNAQQRADQLLELARDRQGELVAALKSLDTNNAILRRTRGELITARREAEKARLMKEQFAANVSHELRTPLNLIIGFSEVMCLSSEVYGDMRWPDALRQDIYQIYRSSRHLLEMIDDVLDLSRFEMAGFTLNRSRTPIIPLIEEVAEICKGFFRGRPVDLITEIASDLPPLEIDRIRIRQALLNLLSNAQRHTARGEVRIEAFKQNGEVIIRVRDTGPGIPPDQLALIFEEFYQVDRSLERRQSGAGLGLAISKHFVEIHGGRIWAESEEGHGATFSIGLPIPGQYAPISRLTPGRHVESMAESGFGPLLVVEPDARIASWVNRQLPDLDVVHVPDASRAAEQTLRHHPQLILWNVPPGTHPDYGSLEGIPVASVECSLPSQSWLATNLAVTACLVKPITASQLQERMTQIGNVADLLVIDDDRGFCRLVRRMVRSNGWRGTVRQAFDGEEGLRLMREQPPDLVLLDLVMPRLDGFEVLGEMQQDPTLAKIAVILLTSSSYAEDALSQQGGDLVVHRPGGLRPAEVLRSVEVLAAVLEPTYDERTPLADSGLAEP